MIEKLETQMITKNQAKVAHRLFIVDGHSFCFRAYYAIRELSNSKGEPTNALYGFITMLRKLIANYNPEAVAVCFDRKEPTFRHKLYDKYKANRSPMPEDLIPQMEPIKEFCRASNFPIYELAGYEADDVMGTMAMQAAAEGYEVYLITGDKDMMQLVNEKILILNPHKEEVIGIQGVKKKWDGLGPDRIIDLMALMGDVSDNIPGVPGVGPKTALKLIQEFDTLENLMGNLSKIKSKRQRQLLEDNKELALLSKQLVTIDKYVPIDIDWKTIVKQEPNNQRLLEIFERCEFRSLIQQFGSKIKNQADAEKRQYTQVRTIQELKNLVGKLKNAKAFAFDTETTHIQPMLADLVGMSFCAKDYEAYYVPVKSEKHQGSGLDLKEVLEIVKPILEDESLKKFGQNLKYDFIVMKRQGVHLKGFSFDTMIASYLINPAKFNHNLDDISLEHLGVHKVPTSDLLGKGKNQTTMDQVDLNKVTEYACEDADCVFRLVPILKQQLEDKGLATLFEATEIPLSLILATMEMNGVFLDIPLIKELSQKTGEELELLTKKIYEEAGEEFNINSTKQLAEIFFEKKKYPTVKKTKTGFSTDVNVLEKLAFDYELPRMILQYREKAKLKSTYLDALPELIHPETHVIHTSYHQTVTATGRLSSSDPNLQNIPIKTEEGRQIRKAFVSRHGHQKGLILSADYSQIELRILAHFSEDENLIKAFSENKDVHRFTATLLYDVDEENVTREMRNVAKTINFSIIYGKTAFGLSQDLNLSVSEASQFIENYFKRYHRVRDYLEFQKEKARDQGYLTTLLGRRAYFPDIHSKNIHMRNFAERAAINAPIQGSAADLIKIAMIQIQQDLEKASLKSVMTMQVHDELVFDAPREEEAVLEKIVRTGMEEVCSLKVPLVADVSKGDSWFKV